MALLLVVLCTGFLLYRRTQRDSERSRSAGISTPLPDPPSPEEQAFLHQFAAGSRSPTDARNLGEYYLQQDRPFEALWAYSFAHHARPNDTATNLGLARALDAALLLHAAIERLVAARAHALRDESAGAHLAELYLRTGQPEMAQQVIEQAGKSDRAGAAGARLEGRVLQALGQAVRAEQAYRRAIERDGQDTRSWHRLGLLLLDQGRLSEARRALARARSLDGTEPRYAVDLGRAFAAGNEPADQQKALDLYREAAETRSSAPAYHQAGLLHARNRRWPAAAESFKRAIAADPNLADPYLELARLLELSGRRAEAHFQRGLYYSAKGLRTRSLQEYRAMARADPARPDGLLMASQGHFKMLQFAQAKSVSRQAWKRDPRSPEAREQSIAIAITAVDRKWAKQKSQEWLDAEPNAVTPLWMLGRIAVDEHRYEDGIRYHEQALARRPDDPEIVASLGKALLAVPGSQHQPRALEVLGRAAALAPQDAKVRYHLGLALMRLGHLEPAQRQMLRSLDLDPNQAAPYSSVVQLAQRLQQPEVVALFAPMVRDVEQRLREELQLWRRTWDKPDDPAGFLNLARFLIRTADLQKAESQLEQALTLRPRWPDAERELSRVRRLLAVL